jgi:hypothetical protein
VDAAEGAVVDLVVGVAVVGNVVERMRTHKTTRLTIVRVHLQRVVSPRNVPPQKPPAANLHPPPPTTHQPPPQSLHPLPSPRPSFTVQAPRPMVQREEKGLVEVMHRLIITLFLERISTLFYTPHSRFPLRMHVTLYFSRRFNGK